MPCLRQPIPLSLMATSTCVSVATKKSSTSSSPPPTSLSVTTTNQTTYVQAEPSTFKELVQKLTGAPEDSSNKLPVTLPPRSSSTFMVGPPRKPPPPSSTCFFKRPKLQERRRAPAKLEIKLGPAPSVRYKSQQYYHQHILNSTGIEAEMVVLSPVSTMDSSLYLSSPSPNTPSTTTSSPPSALEEKAIADKGFYLHPSPKNYGQRPKLLPLFPLHSPRDTDTPPFRY